MKIRRYMANNTQEAILKVKMDLGNDAIILNTRKVRQKGFLKLFSKPLIEVLAAIDDDYGKKKDNDTHKKEVENTKKEETHKPEPQKAIIEKDNRIVDLENKVNSMEGLLQKIYGELSSNKVANNPQESNNQNSSKILDIFYGNLLKNEVEPDLAKKIIDMVEEKLGKNASVNEAAPMLYNILNTILGSPDTIKIKEAGKPTKVIFVGPTGVGKTTTLAKIAANFALNQKKTVGLITADTYRIAAVEQLKTYAEILGMPVSVIYSASEIKEAINQYSDKDVILIDTAGRSHKNKNQFEELKNLVFDSEADEIFLVLSTTISMRSCKEVIKNYDFIKDYKLIFTKLDESPINGIILNTRHMTNKCLSYLTNGQSVPDDIEVANIDKITKNLLGSIS